ncbi:carbohydrate ABC transporter permease [Paenibacillus periandrae]|uniref:carbohydrate ABC transporter permease n=1 Tax=Paenibacillus periandrae TaxID=1761741 RepID=UPI001F097BAA|nr:carbohydrate ABC transporter permease [Paenibacillus periandrae]
MSTVVHRPGKSLKLTIINIIRYMVLVLHSVVTILPLVWILSNSFRNNDQIFTNIRLIPESFQLTNYIKVLTVSNIPLAFYHSLSITLVSLTLLLCVVLPAAFVISRFRFRGAHFIYMFLSLALFVPSITVLPMLYKLYNQLGFLGQKYPIVFAYVVEQLPISIFLLVTFMRGIPRELEEAAIIDGCSTWNIFSRIIVPLSNNAIITILILSFVANWNDYLQALILIPEFRTLTVALAFAKDEYTVDYGMMSASIIFAITPMIIFYLLIKERLINGMAAGAIKG